MISRFLRLLDGVARLRLRGRLALSVAERSKVRYAKIGGAAGCRLSVGQDSLINGRISFDRAGAAIVVGDRCYIGDSHLVSAEGIELGNDVVISWGVTIVDHNSHALEFEERREDILQWARGNKAWTNVRRAKVVLEDGVWVGFNAIILKGVRIGARSIVGAGGVVTKDVPPDTIVAGNPARPIRTLDQNA